MWFSNIASSKGPSDRSYGIHVATTGRAATGSRQRAPSTFLRKLEHSPFKGLRATGTPNHNFSQHSSRPLRLLRPQLTELDVDSASRPMEAIQKLYELRQHWPLRQTPSDGRGCAQHPRASPPMLPLRLLQAKSLSDPSQWCGSCWTTPLMRAQPGGFPLLDVEDGGVGLIRVVDRQWARNCTGRSRACLREACDQQDQRYLGYRSRSGLSAFAVRSPVRHRRCR